MQWEATEPLEEENDVIPGGKPVSWKVAAVVQDLRSGETLHITLNFSPLLKHGTCHVEGLSIIPKGYFKICQTRKPSKLKVP